MMSGLVKGLFLMEKTFFTAETLKALAASPYTVSVGMATTSPSISVFIAFKIVVSYIG